MKQRIGIIASLMLAASCGGGGGGDEADFAGVWTGNLTLVDDSCNAIDPTATYVFFTHLVNQDGQNVVLDNGLVTFAGTADSADSFEVAAERPYADPLYPGATCNETIVWRYDEIHGNTAQFVVRRSTVACTGGGRSAVCEFALSGNAFKADDRGVSPPVIFAEDGAATVDAAGGVAETSL